MAYTVESQAKQRTAHQVRHAECTQRQPVEPSSRPKVKMKVIPQGRQDDR